MWSAPPPRQSALHAEFLISEDRRTDDRPGTGGAARFRRTSAYVAHPEAHQAEVVSVFRITPRDE
jgi:hypothetical protein